MEFLIQKDKISFHDFMKVAGLYGNDMDKKIDKVCNDVENLFAGSLDVLEMILNQNNYYDDNIDLKMFVYEPQSEKTETIETSLHHPYYSSSAWRAFIQTHPSNLNMHEKMADQLATIFSFDFIYQQLYPTYVKAHSCSIPNINDNISISFFRTTKQQKNSLRDICFQKNQKTYVRLIINGEQKYNFLYDFLIDKIGLEKNGNFVPLKDDIKNMLFSSIPDISFDMFPSLLKDFVRKNFEDKYFCEPTHLIYDQIPLSIRLKHFFMPKQWTLSKLFAYSIPETIQLIGSNTSINLIGDSQVPEENSLSNDVKSNIKNILTNLKLSKIILNPEQKISIPNSLFFSSISDEKKEIDSFFLDQEILVNCSLKKIDFTNADLRGVDLSNTDAKIRLDCLYLKSIENANLENVNLLGQDIEEINCNGANLIGTDLTAICIDRCSIQGTIFDESTCFILGMSILDNEIVKKMGINIKPSDQLNTEAEHQLTLS